MLVALPRDVGRPCRPVSAINLSASEGEVSRKVHMKALELFRLVLKARQEHGWGRALRSAVASWYVARPVAEVAADILRCPAHQGWTHRDLVRLAHPKPAT